MKIRARTAILLLIAFGVAAWAVWWRPQNNLTLHNRSGKGVAWMTIAASDEKQRFEGLASGESRSVTFRVGPRNHFVVEGQFSDGTSFGGQVGYITNDVTQHVVISIGPDGQIRLDQQRPSG